MSTKLPFLRKIQLFVELDEQELSRLDEITLKRTYRKNAHIFMEGEPRQAVFFIQKGIVKIYRIDPDGNEQVVSFLKEGDMFPHTGFFDAMPYPANAIVVEATELFVIPVNAFEQLILDMPSIAIKLMRVMGQKIRELQSKLYEFVTQDVNRRIVSFLIRMAGEHGQNENGSIRIDIPLTNQEFANMVGTTRETVNRVMNHLKKNGIIEMSRSSIVILDFEGLLKKHL